MKYRESGMPDENLWRTFFDPAQILNLMGINEKIKILVDIGCGYGTFLFPASKFVEKVIGIDIDKRMIEYCSNIIQENKFKNIELIDVDISQNQTIQEKLSLYSNQIDYITLFNILHCEDPVKLLQSIYNILKHESKIGVIHWKHQNTPRGPSMEIRPTPEQIMDWANIVGFTTENEINLPPYHYGIVFKK